jgi:predicted dehydrogenase
MAPFVTEEFLSMAQEKAPVSRRDFIRRSAAGAAAASTAASVLSAASYARAYGANERLRVGFVGVGGRCQAHIDSVLNLQAAGEKIEAAAVCDVYTVNRDKSAKKIKDRAGNTPISTGDYRELLSNKDIDVITVATPDHWHARQTIDSLRAGKHVYCEKPMTHTIQESQDVVAAWQSAGKIMQVGVQGTSDGRWKAANEFIRAGGIGKVVQGQTEYYRNSGVGQWRYYGLSREMTPKNIDWKTFLGTEFGLAPDMPFDRAVFGQWRCYWPFGSGLYTDLFVHRLTAMITAAGLRYPRRVVGGGGIFLEYDGRQVPDTATIIADYDEGVQIVVTATMCCDYKIEQCIRGHHGTEVFDHRKDGFDFSPERPQVTRLRDVQKKHVSAHQPKPKEDTLDHWRNFLDAIAKNDPQACNNAPDLGAAAITTITMGAESYRSGKVFEWDKSAGKVVESGAAYAKQWEKISQERGEPRHISGWNPENKDPMFSRQKPPDYQKLEGPWINGQDPAA